MPSASTAADAVTLPLHLSQSAGDGASGDRRTRLPRHPWQAVTPTSDSPPEPPQPGLHIIKGSTLSIPDGGFEVSLDESGSATFQIRIQVAIPVWVDWLVIAFARYSDTRRAREQMKQAIDAGDDTARSTALIAEFRGGLQTITAAVLALDAFYGIISAMITIPEQERKARKANKTPRAAWVSDAICRAARIPNDKKKNLISNINVAYDLRDDAVHPKFKPADQGIHPGLNQAVPKYFLDYTLENSEEVLKAMIEAIMFVTDRPQIKNADIAAYAPDASSLLHETVDKNLTYESSLFAPQ